MSGLSICRPEPPKSTSRRARISSWAFSATSKTARADSGVDAAGNALKIGDTVTITLKVTGFHAMPDDLENGLKGLTSVNLSRPLGKSGVDQHFISVPSRLVTKKG